MENEKRIQLSEKLRDDKICIVMHENNEVRTWPA